MIRRPPRSTLDRSSAASDVYKRQLISLANCSMLSGDITLAKKYYHQLENDSLFSKDAISKLAGIYESQQNPVSYTHIRAHETVLDLVCRLLLEKKTISRLAYAT